jgi:hypothetical protein
MLKHHLPFHALFKPLSHLNWPKQDVTVFRTTYFQPEVPVTLRREPGHTIVPAIQKWFAPLTVHNANHKAKKLSEHNFEAPWNVMVPVELIGYKQRSDFIREEKEITFERGNTSLEYFKSWITQSLEGPSGPDTNSSLYLAQCDLDLLPKSLRDDLPSPSVITKAGKGDVYASSLWMGISPTHTPLHKDPNPNVLVQLAGKKVVRMLQPQLGKAVYESTRRLSAEAEGDTAVSGSSMRGEEMMVGLERKILDTFVWGSDCGEGKGSKIEESKGAEMVGYETTLDAGDGVFIPKGWWHSVRGVGNHKDGINASVSCIQLDKNATGSNASLLRSTGGFDEVSPSNHLIHLF